MGVKPVDCLVIEDSPLGVAAAVAAGMKVFGYAGMTDPAKLSDADTVFHNMSALADLIDGPETLRHSSTLYSPHGVRPVRAEAVVDLAAIRHNVGTLRARAEGAQLIRPWSRPTVRARRGAVARAAREAGADWLGAATPEEALALRAAGTPDVPVMCWLWTPGDPGTAASRPVIDMSVSGLWALEDERGGARDRADRPRPAQGRHRPRRATAASPPTGRSWSGRGREGRAEAWSRSPGSGRTSRAPTSPTTPRSPRS